MHHSQLRGRTLEGATMPLGDPHINIGVICGKSIYKDVHTSRSRSSAMGDEDYFDWCESMER